jgi:C1q domain
VSFGHHIARRKLQLKLFSQFEVLSQLLAPEKNSSYVLQDFLIVHLVKKKHRSLPVTNLLLGFVVVYVMQAAVMVLKNGEMVATVWAESIPYWSTASNVAVLNLERGDQVWLLLLSRASYLHGYMYTTFSGSIVFTL